jgi:two-component system chemotaxis response regulator CheB
MERQPRPILVVSVSVEAGSTNVFNLLEAGAVDVFPKPSAIQAADMDRLAAELASRIRILAGVHVMRRANHVQAMATAPKGLRPAAPPRMVVIGASTGGPQALQQILSHLPEDFPLPLVCVQHIGATFLSELVAWLDDACCLSVRVAIQGELPRGGVVYFAPSERHLAFNQEGRFWLQPGPLCDGHCPSVTITLRAAAQHFGAAAVGVLLTGMGRDGADGIAAISRAGGMTIAQDEASSVVYGMPKEAVNLGVVRHQLPLIEIAPALMVLTNAK